MTIIQNNKVEVEEMHIEHDIHGTVRWGLGSKYTPVESYYFGIELDELLPLRQAADNHEALPGPFRIFQKSTAGCRIEKFGETRK